MHRKNSKPLKLITNSEILVGILDHFVRIQSKWSSIPTRISALFQVGISWELGVDSGVRGE